MKELKEKYKKETWNRDLDIDCIEIDDTLCQTLKGKELRVVYNDFLTFAMGNEMSLWKK